MNKKMIPTTDTVISSLATHGATFDRATLNKMLDNLGKTRTPKRLLPGAMCYSRIFPKSKFTEFICPVCGTRTSYFIKDWQMSYKTQQDTAERWRAKGVDIKLDPTPCCSKCNPALILTPPTATSDDKDTYTIQEGDTLELIAKKLNTTQDNIITLNRGNRGGDWIRCDYSEQKPYLIPGITLSLNRLPYVQKEPASYWIINGKRIQVKPDDVAIINAFLDKETWVDVFETTQLKDKLPRLRELFGTPK